MLRIGVCRRNSATWHGALQRSHRHLLLAPSPAVSSARHGLLLRGTSVLLAPKRGHKAIPTDAPVRSSKRPKTSARSCRPRTSKPSGGGGTVDTSTTTPHRPVDVLRDVLNRYISVDVFRALQQQAGAADVSPSCEVCLVLTLLPDSSAGLTTPCTKGLLQRYDVRLVQQAASPRTLASCCVGSAASHAPPQQEGIAVGDNNDGAGVDSVAATGGIDSALDDDGFNDLLGVHTLSTAVGSGTDARGATTAKLHQPTPGRASSRGGLLEGNAMAVDDDDAAQVAALTNTLRVFLAASHPNCSVGPVSFTRGTTDGTVTAFVSLVRSSPPHAATMSASRNGTKEQQQLFHGEAVGTTQREAFVDAMSEALFEASIKDLPPFLRSHMAAVCGTAVHGVNDDAPESAQSNREVFESSIAGRLWAMLRHELLLRPVTTSLAAGGRPMTTPQLRIDGMAPTADGASVRALRDAAASSIALRLVAVHADDDACGHVAEASTSVELASHSIDGSGASGRVLLASVYLRLLHASILRVNPLAGDALRDIYAGSPCVLSHMERRSPKRVLERAACHFLGHRRCLEVVCTTGSFWAWDGTMRITLPASPVAKGASVDIRGYTFEVVQAAGGTRKACRDAVIQTLMQPTSSAPSTDTPFPAEFHAQLELQGTAAQATSAPAARTPLSSDIFNGRPPYERGLLVQVRWMLQQVGDALRVTQKRFVAQGTRTMTTAWQTQLHTKRLDDVAQWPDAPAVTMFEFKRGKSEHKALYQLAVARFGKLAGDTFVERFGAEYGAPSTIEPALLASLTEAPPSELDDAAGDATAVRDALRDVVPGFTFTCDGATVRQSPSLLSTLRRAFAEALEADDVVEKATAIVAARSPTGGRSVLHGAATASQPALQLREVVQQHHDALNLQASYVVALEVWLAPPAAANDPDAPTPALVCSLLAKESARVAHHPCAWKATLCAMLDVVCAANDTSGEASLTSQHGGPDVNEVAFLQELQRQTRAIAQELCEYCALPSPNEFDATSTGAGPQKSLSNSIDDRLVAANPLVSLARAMMKLYGCRIEVAAKLTSRDDGQAHVALYATATAGSSSAAYRDLISEGRGASIPEAGLAACRIAFDAFVDSVVPRRTVATTAGDLSDGSNPLTRPSTGVRADDDDGQQEGLLPITCFLPPFEAASMAGTIAAAILRSAQQHSCVTAFGVQQLRFGIQYHRLTPSKERKSGADGAFTAFLELEVGTTRGDAAGYEPPASAGNETYVVTPVVGRDCASSSSNCFDALETLWQALSGCDGEGSDAAATSVNVAPVASDGTPAGATHHEAVRRLFSAEGTACGRQYDVGLPSEIHGILRAFQYPAVFQQTTPAALMDAVAKKRYGIALVPRAQIVQRTTHWVADVAMEVRVAATGCQGNGPSMASRTADTTTIVPAPQLCQFILCAARGASKKDAMRGCIVPLLRDQMVTDRRGGGAAGTRRAILAGEHFTMPTTAVNTTQGLAVRIVPLCR